MKIVCDNCSTKYSIADEKVRGKVFKIKCKKCSHIIVVKGQEAGAEGQPAGFDQKETRVFDYSGFEGQKGAAGAAAGGDGGAASDPIWHMVIDREQVGPLTVGEVQQKWSTGEVDRDTYCWREGFADWQRLGAIDELAEVTRASGGGAGEHEGEPGNTSGDHATGLFGDGSATPAQGTPSLSLGGMGSSGNSGRADPTDLFAGAGTSTEDEMPADLFGSARASGQPAVFSSASASTSAQPAGSRRTSKQQDEVSSFSAGAGGDLSLDGPGGGGKSDIRPMTAQRNENSVLFSLNNLSALAASEPISPSVPSSSGPRESRPSGLGSAFGSSGAEGSGLIDIRAMAAMTLGATKKDEEEHRSRTRRPSEDDLPVFSASSFSAPAAGVLLPTVQPQSNRTFYIAIGVVGLLAVTAIVLVAVILLGNKNPQPASAAVVPGDTLATGPQAPPPALPPETPSTATPAAAPPSGTTPPSRPPAAATPSPTPAVTPPVATGDRPKPAAEPARPTPPKPRDKPVDRPPAEPARTEPKPPPEPSRPAAEPATKPQKCDEVACLVSPDLPCCPKRSGSTKPAPAADSSLPDKLEQADIIAGMKAVNARVNGCNDRFRVPGAFKVKVTVGPDGSVSNATATPPIAGTPAAGCVEGAVRGAKFKKTKNSITFNYPYTFR